MRLLRRAAGDLNRVIGFGVGCREHPSIQSPHKRTKQDIGTHHKGCCEGTLRQIAAAGYRRRLGPPPWWDRRRQP